jgi:hypothetical protein
VSTQGERRVQYIPQPNVNDMKSVSSNSDYSKNIVFDGTLMGVHQSNVYYEDQYLK